MGFDLGMLNKLLAMGKSPEKYLEETQASQPAVGPLVIHTPRWRGGAIDTGQIKLEGVLAEAVPAVVENSTPRGFPWWWRSLRGAIHGRPPLSKEAVDELIESFVTLAGQLCRGLRRGSIVILNLEYNHGFITSAEQLRGQALKWEDLRALLNSLYAAAADSGMTLDQAIASIDGVYDRVLIAWCEAVRAHGCRPGVYEPSRMSKRHRDLFEVWCFEAYHRHSNRAGLTDFDRLEDALVGKLQWCKGEGKTGHVLVLPSYVSPHRRQGQLVSEEEMGLWAEMVASAWGQAGLPGDTSVGMWAGTSAEGVEAAARQASAWRQDLGISK